MKASLRIPLLALAVIGFGLAIGFGLSTRHRAQMSEYVATHAMVQHGEPEQHLTIAGGPFNILLKHSQIFSVPVERQGREGVLWMRTGLGSSDFIFVDQAGQETPLQ